MKNEIIPGILTQSRDELAHKLSQLTGLTHRVHIDIMDGIFVPHTTISLEDLQGLDTILDIELHLMVVHPERYLEAAQKNLVRRVIVHVEAMQEPKSVLHEISALGMKRGIAVSPETQLEKLFAVAPFADQITVMGVNPGAAGQALLPQTLSRVSDVHKAFPKIPLEIDGGMRTTNLTEAAQCGANLFVANSSLFGSPNIEDTLRSLRRQISE